MKGYLTYWARTGKQSLKSLKLTVCCEEEAELKNEEGLARLRRKRLSRLIEEAKKQGVKLTYRDLSLILLSSKATLKRDFKEVGQQPE